MDIATIIGLLAGLALIIGSMLLDPGGIMPFVNIPSLMITIGGAFSALLINFPLSNVLQMLSVVKKCFLTRLPEHAQVILQFRKFSEVARREGLLALENELEQINDLFLRQGLEMVIGGAGKEEICMVLEIDMDSTAQRHLTGKKVMDALAAAAPAFGMIGTLIGLVQMLRTLDDPSKIGMGMATALLTTFYGAVVANLFCIPMAGKLEARSQDELAVKELMKNGLCLLIEGIAPSAMQERLAAYLSGVNRQRLLGQDNLAA
jgi:chemotaxis protein MotA